MKMNHLTYRIGVMIVASLMVYALAVFFVIQPMWLKNQDRLNQIQERTVDKEVVLLRRQQLPVIQDQVERIRQATSDLVVTASANDPIHWVRDLETLAKDTGNTITIEIDDTISPKPKVVAKKPTTQSTPGKEDTSNTSTPNTSAASDNTKNPKRTLQGDMPFTTGQGLRLTVMGDYFSLTAFLKKLELLPYYVDVFSISFSKTDTPNSTSAPAPTVPRNIFQTTNDNAGSGDSPVPKDIRPMQAILGVVVALSENNQ